VVLGDRKSVFLAGIDELRTDGEMEVFGCAQRVGVKARIVANPPV